MIVFCVTEAKGNMAPTIWHRFDWTLTLCCASKSLNGAASLLIQRQEFSGNVLCKKQRAGSQEANAFGVRSHGIHYDHSGKGNSPPLPSVSLFLPRNQIEHVAGNAGGLISVKAGGLGDRKHLIS
jgi:hypothetical protein